MCQWKLKRQAGVTRCHVPVFTREFRAAGETDAQEFLWMGGDV